MADRNTKKVLLDKAMTWASVNYAPGLNTMPEAAANYASRRKFGKIVGEDEGELDFELLPLAETLKRFGDGDNSEQVMKSLNFHQTQAAQTSEKSSEGGKQTGTGDGKGEGGQKTENDGLPEDFPMKHVFEAPNKLSETGFKTVAEIQAFSRDDLISIDGIGGTTADKALAYGK